MKDIKDKDVIEGNNDLGSGTPEKLYDLGFHEEYSPSTQSGWMIKRVPGGWIYTYHRLDQGQMNSVFVPFNTEFSNTQTKQQQQ